MSQGGPPACEWSCTSCGRGDIRGAASQRDDSECAAGAWKELWDVKIHSDNIISWFLPFKSTTICVY